MKNVAPNNLTQKILKKNLRYDPDAGLFFWNKAKPRIHVGKQAGHKTSLGYIRITINGRRYMAHVLAWFYMTGEYLVRGIDHEDTVGTNNKWCNLRRASQSQNNRNTKVRCDNATGIKGARLKKGKGARPFYATINIDGKQRHLGYFDTVEEAHAAYAAKAKELFGRFARTK